MIFVAVGTQKFQFNRLLIEIDRLIEKKLISEKVFAQIGNSNYSPKNFDFINFMSKSEFEKNIKKCKILITHSGVGTIIDGIINEKSIIIVPRRAKFSEHVDDHQLEIAESFSKLNFTIFCDEISQLEKCIKKCEGYKFNRYVSSRNKVIETIRDYLLKL